MTCSIHDEKARRLNQMSLHEIVIVIHDCGHIVGGRRFLVLKTVFRFLCFFILFLHPYSSIVMQTINCI